MQDFTKPTIITGQQYGTKISVEIDHSDTSIDELFDAFQTICIGLGYHQSTWKEWVMGRADEYREEDFENRYSFNESVRDSETFFNAITNPPQPTETLKKAFEDYVNKLDVSKIDEALAEHNEDEWNDEMETQYWENEGNEHMPPELEEQFWNEQPPEPFATPEEVERYNIDGEFDDYGKRIVKSTKKVGRRGIKKK